MMKFLQALVFRLVFVAILAAGVLLAIFELHELYDLAVKYLPNDETIRWSVTIGAVVVGVAGLVFGWRGRVRGSRKIEFQSRHGYIVIELDSVQKSLQKAMAKLPEVKDISLKVYPSDNDRKVRIVADAVVFKPPGAGIRETASNLEDKLAESAKRMLGVDDIASLDLNISRVLMNVKKEFDNVESNRLLEHRVATPAPAPVAVAPASAPQAANPEPAAQAPASESEPAANDASETDKEASKSFWRG